MEEKTWETGPIDKLPDDPLLACLILLAKIHHKPWSVEVFTAGLPLVNHRLTPELFIRAAARIGFAAKIMKRSLNKISPLMLPAVMLLKDQQACILVEQNNNNAKIIQPEMGAGAIDLTAEKMNEIYAGHVIYIKPEYQFTERSEEAYISKPKHWFWDTIGKAFPIYSEVLVASFLINLFALASPLFIMNVYDRVVPNHAIETLWVLASGVFIVFCFDFLMRGLRGYFIDMAGKNVDIQFSSMMFEQLLNIQMAARPSSVGSLANIVQSFEAVREFLTSATVSVLVDLPFALFFILVVYMLGGSLVFIPLIAIPVVMTGSYLVQIPLDKLTKDSFRYATEKHATLVESLLGVETIKTMRAEGRMQQRWESLVCDLAKIGVKTRFFANASLNFSLFFQYVTSALVVIFGVYQIAAGQLTVGALVACTILTGRAMVPISQVASLVTRYHQTATALKSFADLMAKPVERPSGKTFLHRPILHGNIEFQSVTYNYPEQIVPAVKNVSFKIKAGEHVAIIGRVGSGKSTIAKLMMKLYQPTKGSILVDGADLQQIDPAELRYHVSYVPQNPILFYGSIKDNILFGSHGADDEAVLHAAALVGIDGFINRHPQGFNLQVGERGSFLSGGQRQSIAIARSIVHEQPILLFDEATNDMDDTSEAIFRNHLTKYLTNKTLILITHRGSMLSLVDRIIILDNGSLIADGPKEEILQKLREGKINAARA